MLINAKLSIKKGLLLCGAAAVFSCAQAETTAEGLAPLPPLPQAEVVTQDPNSIRVLLSPEVETTLVAQMAAQVANLNAGLGAKVAKGDVLIQFDCAETQARLRMAQAEHAAARETLGVKQRLLKLNAAGDIEVSLARAEVNKSSAAIAVNQAQLAHCAIKAPFDGRVVKLHVKPFQGVSAGAPLLELVSDGPLKLRLNVPSRILSQITVGTEITVDIFETNKSYRASITAINARVDAVAQTIELEAHLDEGSQELLPGMSGIAHLPVPKS